MQQNTRQGQIAIKNTLYTSQFIGLSVTNFLFWFGVYIYIPVLPLYFYSQGMNSQEIGLMIGSFSLGAVLLRFAGGKAADRYGTAPVAVAGLLVAGCALAGYWWFQAAYAVMLLVRFIHGMGSSLYSTGAVTMVTLLPGSGEATKQRIALYTLGSMIGIGIATAGASWLFGQWGYSGIILLSIGVTVAGLLLIPKQEVYRKRQQTCRESLSTFALVSDPTIYLPTLNQFAVYVGYACVMTYLPLQCYGKGTDLSWFYVSYTVSVITSRFLARQLSERIEARRVSGFLLAIMSAVLLLPVFSTAWFSLLLLGCGLGLGVGLAIPVLSGIITDATNAENRGTAMGFFTTAIDLGMAAGAILLGPLANSFDYGRVFITASAYTCITFILYWKGMNGNLVSRGQFF